MDLSNMLIGDELKHRRNDIKKIFFFRICGTGMGACACLLKEAGFDVEGADISFSPPMSTYLQTTGIPCHELKNVDAKFLQQYDLIIVGNSVPRNSDHAYLIESCGVSFTSFPEVLGEYILDTRDVVGIAGTHGKTTTTYFLTQILEKLGEKPGYFVGGVINGRAPSRLGESKYFVIESDEYDSAYFQKISKFRLYRLNHMILTSLEFDHADIFDSVEDIENEFSHTIPQLNGHIIGNKTYPSIDKLQNKFSNKNWLRYQSTEVGPKIIDVSQKGCRFELSISQKTHLFETNVVGEHNILNISACILFLASEGFKITEISKAIGHLDMVKRRQEERGHYRGSLVIDDFAHHPRAIELTIAAIKQKYPGRPLLTVFEPVSATARSACFQQEFAQSLRASEKVIIAQSPIASTAKKYGNLDCDQLVLDVKNERREAFCARELSVLQDKINQWIERDSILLILSNRTCIGLWESKFVDEII